MSKRIQVGYASDTRPRKPKNAYGKRSSGKKVTNGGFSGESTVDFVSIDQKDWDRVFPNSYKPHWDK